MVSAATCLIRFTPPEEPPASVLPGQLLYALDLCDCRNTWSVSASLDAHMKLICRIRNVCAGHFVLGHYVQDRRFGPEFFLSLGFHALPESSLPLPDVAADTALYSYTLENYKTRPDWLNADFWAHPERWVP